MEDQPFQLQEEGSPSTTFGIAGGHQEQTKLLPNSKRAKAQSPFSDFTKSILFFLLVPILDLECQIN